MTAVEEAVKDDEHKHHESCRVCGCPFGLIQACDGCFRIFCWPCRGDRRSWRGGLYYCRHCRPLREEGT